VHQELSDVKLYSGGVEVPEDRLSQRGQNWAAEWVQYSDPLTGREVTRFTSSRATDQHPYFTGPAMTADGGRLIFMSGRTGNPNLFSLDMQSGEILQLTDNRYGVLRQYVFPWGNLVGFGKSSVSLNAATGDVFYLQGREIRRVNAYTAQEVCIAELPPGWVTAFTHVSTDNALLCVPLVPEDAFALSHEATDRRYHPNGFGAIVERIHERELKSLLWVVATDGSRQEIWAEQESWITHVQFRPNDNRYLLFNNEGIGNSPDHQRIWMCDGNSGDIWKVRPRPTDDERFWTCHEVWTEDSTEILYHGGGTHPTTGENVKFYGFSDLSGQNFREYYLRPQDVNCGYGHFGTHSQSNYAYCDGFFDAGLITEVWPGEDGYVQFRPICRHDSHWVGQDDHPHPILTPDHSMVIFSSSAEGTGNVYGVRL
jgi:oligogalacturonide lyase